MASPPAWLLAALAAPHAFGLLPLLAPRQLASVAARLGHTDAAVPFTAGSLVLGCCQAAALMQFLVDSRAAGSEEAISSAALPFAVRAALATPLLIGGVALKLGALRLSRVHFGKQPGSRECAAPLSREFPYTLTGASRRHRACARCNAPASAPQPALCHRLRVRSRLLPPAPERRSC